MSFWTVDQTRRVCDAGNDRLVAVVVAREGIEGVVLVVSRTADSQHILSPASLLIRPVAPMDTLIIYQSFRMTSFALGDAPRTLGVVSSALGSVLFREDAELPGTSWRRYWTGCCFRLGTRYIPLIGTELVNSTMFLVQQAVGTGLQGSCSVHTQVIFLTVCIVVVVKDSFWWTSVWRNGRLCLAL